MQSNLYPSEFFLRSAHRDQLELLSDFDNRKWRWALVNWHRRARKSSLSLVLLIKECLRNPKKRYVYLTSTFTAARSIVLRDPNMLKRWLPMDQVDKINESELFVQFKNGSILSILGSDKPDSIRGIDVCGVVIDEAPLCKREVYEEILRPILAQDKSRWMAAIFTPKGRANWVFELWEKARDNPDWARYILTADTSGIIPKEELEKVKLEMPARVYAQEFGCDFTESSASVFKNINLCVAGELEQPKNNQTYCVGIDLARVDDFSCLVVLCRETRHVVAFERFNQLDWSFQKEKILALCRKYNAFAVVDATGVGDPIAQDLERSGAAVMPFKISAQSKKTLIERLIVAIEQRHITFPKIEVLINELGLFSYEITDHGNVRFAAPEGMHDDTVIALALAVQGLGSFLYGKKERKPMPMPKEEERLNAGVAY